MVFGKRLRPRPRTSIEDRPVNRGKRLMAPEVEAVLDARSPESLGVRM